jgi:parallel beta-helix repeat protein
MSKRERMRTALGVATLLVLIVLTGCGPTTPEATPTAEPTPTAETKTIRFAPDGSGDYATLEAAIEAAEEGSIIEIEAGTYRLEQPLRIVKAISLLGAGMDGTELVSAAGPFVVHFKGDGPFEIKGITIRHEGQTWADVVIVEGGDVTFERCRVAGGRGAGLLLGGETAGTVRDCVAETGGGAIGISVTGQAHPTLVGNTSSGNGYGIRISEQAYPTLENNTCNDNSLDGIRYDDDAGGVARGNKASGNRTGFVATGQAQPRLEENIATNNKMAGFEFAEDARGVALRNESSGNFGGMGVSDQAQPTLEENIVTGNVTAGIAYFRSGGGTARKNDCTGNGIDGISVFEEAAPLLQENVCNNNGERGIHFGGSSGGVARNNECSRNRIGILVTEASTVELEGNGCEENTETDVEDLRP